MNRTITHGGMLATCLAAALVLAWALPGKAGGATQLGQVAPGDSPDCGTANLVQPNTTSAASYEVPSPGGVITRWSHRGRSGGSGSGRLQVWEHVGGTSDFTLVGRSSLEAFTADTVNVFTTRIPVGVGDELGLRAGVNVGCAYAGSPGDVIGRELGSDPAPGDTRTFGGFLDMDEDLLNVAAVLEPDADGDGFGDETQDECPGEAGPSNGCPPPEDGTPPPDDGLLPSNDFSFGKLKRNKKRGTAKLPVEVPGPGEVELAKTKKVKPDTEQLKAAAAATAQEGGIEAKLTIKPKGKAKKKLNRKGKAKVKAKVTYTPDGGEPNTQSKRVGLKKR